MKNHVLTIATCLALFTLAPAHAKWKEPASELKLYGEAHHSGNEWLFIPDAKMKKRVQRTYRLVNFEKHIGRIKGNFLYIQIFADREHCAGKTPCLDVKGFRPAVYDLLKNHPALTRMRDLAGRSSKAQKSR